MSHGEIFLFFGTISVMLITKENTPGELKQIWRQKFFRLSDYIKKAKHSIEQKQSYGKENAFAVKKPKLNIRFHNPNTAEATADFLLKLFIDANQSKVENAINSAIENSSLQKSTMENRSA